MEQSEQDQESDLMPKATEVTPPSSPGLEIEQVPSKQGDNIYLEYNIAFDESQHIII